MTDQEFHAYVADLNRREMMGEHVLMFCAHCGQELFSPEPEGLIVVFVPGHYADNGEEVLSALHQDCEHPWRQECERSLIRN